MAEEKLNTAEHDSKGRCVRHPAIRLRKKKLLGGWKILIGHCPECCLDEMRRVRDEIDGDKKKKKKSKKKNKSSRTDKSLGRTNSNDGISLTSEGYDPKTAQGRARRHREDGESESTSHTGSTAQMSVSGSVVSEQYYRGDGPMGSSPGHHHPRSETFRGRGPFHHQQQVSSPYQKQERTMVLSMAFVDPQTGQKGTYTGQVSSINNHPDGKGTVYYNNGSIAEGTWSNGILLDGSDDEQEYERPQSQPQPHSHSKQRDRSSSRPRDRSSSRPRGEDGYGNLHLLNDLPGSKSRPRGGSASVQSYNSRGSHQDHGFSGSASVQGGYPGYGEVYDGRSGSAQSMYGSGVYGGGMSRYHPPPRESRKVRKPPIINERGEYEP